MTNTEYQRMERGLNRICVALGTIPILLVAATISEDISNRDKSLRASVVLKADTNHDQMLDDTEMRQVYSTIGKTYSPKGLEGLSGQDMRNYLSK